MIARRSALRFGGWSVLAAAAAACSRSTARSRVSGSASAARASTSASALSTSAPAAQAVRFGGAHVRAAQAVTVADARRFAPLMSGHWRGGWRDTAGRNGGSDLVLSVDPTTRTARASVETSGPILGSAVAPASYEIDLLSFGKTAAAWTVQSPQLGRVRATADGGTTLTGTATHVPGHPEIASIDLSGTRVGLRFDGRYTITGTDGSTTTGTIAWGRGAQPATPHDPSATSFNSSADVMSGQYAASFLTSAALSAAMGRPTAAPVSNGGRLAYAPGIDVSNALATTADNQVAVQYSIYRGASAALTARFWHGELLGQPNVPGPWTAAFFQFPGAATLYAYRQRRVLLINLVQTVQATHPPSRTELNRLTLAVAKVLMPALNSR